MRKRLKVNDIRMDYRIVILAFMISFYHAKAALYGFGPETTDVPISYDSWVSGTQKIDLLSKLPMLGGAIVDSIWVNSFGSISLNKTTSGDISTITDNIIFAPFFSASQQGTEGVVYIRQSVTHGPLFEEISRDISAFETNIEGGFSPTYGLLVTWSGVASPDDSSKINTFQLVLTTDGTKTYLLYMYVPLDWTSSAGKFAVAGIHAVRNKMEFCSSFLEGSGTAQVYQLAMTSNIIGSMGIHVLDITNPLHCTSGFATMCGAYPPPGRWVFRPRFELVSDDDLEMNFYLDFVCKPGFFITRDVTTQKLNCKYESDYYNHEWDEEMPMCFDLNATRRFITTIEVSKINNEIVFNEFGNLKEVTGNAISKLLETVGITNVINAIDDIRNGTLSTTDSNSTNPVVVVEFTTYIPSFTNKRLTNDSLLNKLVDEIHNNNEINLVSFMEENITVTDMTTSCLQECLCRNLKDPILCRRGDFKPELLPDACCGKCGGKMIPYASSIKACCGNRRLYDPKKKICCKGQVRSGHECP